jgi:hypothetical protein
VRRSSRDRRLIAIFRTPDSLAWLIQWRFVILSELYRIHQALSLECVGIRLSRFILDQRYRCRTYCILDGDQTYPQCSLKESLTSFRASKRFTYHRTLLQETVWPATLEQIVELALHKLAVHRVSHGAIGVNSHGPRMTQESFKAHGSVNWHNSRWTPESSRRNILTANARMNHTHVQFRITDYEFCDVIDNDSQEALIFCDPFYHMQKSVHRHAFSSEDHERLAESLQTTRHRWVLTYGMHLQVYGLYKHCCIREMLVSGFGGNPGCDLLIHSK